MLLHTLVHAQSTPYEVIKFQHPDFGDFQDVMDLKQDSRGFIWIATRDRGVFRYDGYDLISYKSRFTSRNHISSDLVNTLHLNGTQDTLWIGTAGGEYQYIDIRRDRVQRIVGPKDIERATWIYDLYCGPAGEQWLATEEGLWKLDSQDARWQRAMDTTEIYRNTLVEIVEADRNTLITAGAGELIYKINLENQMVTPIQKKSLGLEDNSEIKALECTAGQIWIGTEDKIYVAPISTLLSNLTLKEYQIPGVPSITNIDLICKTPSGVLIGADEGLYILNDLGELLSSFPSIRNAQSAIIDQNNQIWVGTKANGLFKLRPFLKPFKNVNRDIANQNDFRNNNIHGFWEDEAGLIWFGTEEGLLVYNRSKNELVDLDPYLERSHLLRNTYISTFNIDQDNILWIGTRSNGFFRLGANHSLKRLADIRSLSLSEAGNKYKRYPNTAALITQGEKDQIWVASLNSGLHLFSQDGVELRNIQESDSLNGLPHNGAGAVYYDSLAEILYVGTLGGGLARSKLEDMENPKFEVFRSGPDSESISSNIILSIIPDGDSLLWLGTYGGGLNLMNLHTLSFERFNVATSGFTDDLVWGGTIDDSGYLWVSTSDGLVKFDRQEKKVVHVFNQYDGLPADGFTYFSYYKAKDGYLFFGGKNGFTYFNPESIQINAFKPRTLMTDFTVLNEAVNISDSSLLQSHISFLPDLIFNHKENVFTFTFSSNSFFQPEENQFKYMLEGLDEEWIITNADRRYATYNNLSPGTYRFLVSSSNDDGIWNASPASINILVRPAPWETWWAKIIYIIILCGIIYSIYRTIINRLKLKTNLALQESEAIRLKEISNFKNRFFTNITHEFRTPLTIISGMTKGLQSQSNLSLGKVENLVQKNVETLLRLVNQMLDLAKVESGVLKINLRQGDIVTYLRSQLEVFEDNALAKGLTINLSSDPEKIIMDYDPNIYATILQNLVSNAVKYGGSDEEIRIQLVKYQNQLRLSVKDKGKGIRPKDLPHVFERFYQSEDSVQTGSGVGLALTKELVNWMGGSITVDSIYGLGSTFKVELPITNIAPKESPVTVNFPGPGDQRMAVKRKGSAPLILIVEDNHDLIYYIRSALGPDYQILEAADGYQGKELALHQIPDLIVTDIMMPKVNGFELCKMIKSDEKTSHIPIIMLTAKATVEDRVQGLQHGADAYLAKPFNELELQVRVRKLLEMREVLRNRYSLKGIRQDKIDAATTPAQDEFIEKIRAIVESEIQNEDLKPTYLCEKLFISRTQLHRKISAITGLNTSKFISAIRIEKAQELLIATDKSIEEISYDVGFKNPSYFRRVFKEFTQVSASQYRANH